ncbi:MAG: hypothetical protein H6830_06860 [Planctomycetes bacterium]|nr:hypothetical protein [Planctomycetota bacterium]MCB9911340.1 hypothetical protein [Planctomycetota bacterium]MCB9911505.1 hypothetical protein [Planctomycetota bacterium]
MKKPWSLANRLTLWFTVLTVLLVGMIAGVSTLFVLGATTREFDALAKEEIDELRAIFRDRPLEAEEMHKEANSLHTSHPGVRMAWRLWNKDTGKKWGEFGDTDLLPEAGKVPREPWIRLRQVPFENYQGAETIGPLWIDMLVDGRGRLFPLKKYGVIAGLILLGTGVLALSAGVVFGRKTAGLLEHIANQVHETSVGDVPKWQEENPPVEIQLVAEALTKALARARDEQERSSFLIAGVAHELRSPIQNLLGETEVLLMRDRSTDEYKSILISHTEEIQDLAREIDNLVTLCAHKTNQGHASLETFDLREELRLRVPRELARAQRRDVHLKVELEGDLSVTGDREALLLAFRNLLGNAVSFSPPGSEVRLTVERQGDEIFVAVDDQGPGVPVDQRERIFEPFQRGKEAPGMRSGFGLGLALSREAIEAQGGTIRATESPLGGARFEARFLRGPKGN